MGCSGDTWEAFQFDFIIVDEILGFGIQFTNGVIRKRLYSLLTVMIIVQGRRLKGKRLLHLAIPQNFEKKTFNLRI